MFNLISRFFNKDNSQKKMVRENYAFAFFAQPEHAWILENNLTHQFNQLFKHLPIGVLEALMKDYPISFVTNREYSNNKNSFMKGNTVVVFPQFQKLLASNKGAAVAYLAHEVAFILYELESKSSDSLMAEVEADKFVCDIGLSDELEELLLMLDETIEKRLRLTYLTAHHFSQYN